MRRIFFLLDALPARGNGAQCLAPLRAACLAAGAAGRGQRDRAIRRCSEPHSRS